MTTSNTIEELVGRVERSTDFDNALDIAIDLALFEPDDTYVAVRANAAGTKLVYTRRDGSHDTVWAYDHTLNAATRSHAVKSLRSLRIKGDHNDEAAATDKVEG